MRWSQGQSEANVHFAKLALSSWLASHSFLYFGFIAGAPKASPYAASTSSPPTSSCSLIYDPPHLPTSSPSGNCSQRSGLASDLPALLEAPFSPPFVRHVTLCSPPPLGLASPTPNTLGFFRCDMESPAAALMILLQKWLVHVSP